MGICEELSSCSQNTDLWTFLSIMQRKMVFFQILQHFPVHPRVLLVSGGFHCCSTFIFKNSRFPFRLSAWKKGEMPLSAVMAEWTE